MNYKLHNLITPPHLPMQLEWKFSDEAEIIGWTISARNYNTFVANTMFWSCFIAITIGSYFIYQSMDEDPLFSGALTLAFFATVTTALVSMTHQRMNFAYRFTQTGVEYCEWKFLSKWSLTFLKWFAALTAIIFVFLALIDPSFLIGALIGPGGVVLIYLTMAKSKNYQNIHNQFHHLDFEWKDFTQLAIATNREVIDLKFVKYDEHLKRTVKWSLNIFCNSKQKDYIANVIKPYLPLNTPIIRAKVNVPMSTD
jgi:hypothetical protein